MNQIIERSGLPTKFEEYARWRGGNFLNDFVTRYFYQWCMGKWCTSNGKVFSVGNRMGKAYDEIRKTPYLAYTTGWKVFVEMLQFGLILGSILIICGVSTIFADESRRKCCH